MYILPWHFITVLPWIGKNASACWYLARVDLGSHDPRGKWSLGMILLAMCPPRDGTKVYKPHEN